MIWVIRPNNLTCLTASFDATYGPMASIAICLIDFGLGSKRKIGTVASLSARGSAYTVHQPTSIDLVIHTQSARLSYLCVYVIPRPVAAEDLSIEPLQVEAFHRSLPVLSRQSALAAEAVQLAVLPRAVVHRDGLADLISLEQTHDKVQE